MRYRVTFEIVNHDGRREAARVVAARSQARAVRAVRKATAGKGQRWRLIRAESLIERDMRKRHRQAGAAA